MEYKTIMEILYINYLIWNRKGIKVEVKEKEFERLKEIKKIEEEVYVQGTKSIAGIDEAGRGPLAGPVVVACAVMPRDSMIEGVNDSKKVS